MNDLDYSDEAIKDAKVALFHWLKTDERELLCADFQSNNMLLWERASMTRELAAISEIAKRMLSLVESEAEVERVIGRQRQLLTKHRMNTKSDLFQARSQACLFSHNATTSSVSSSLGQNTIIPPKQNETGDKNLA